MNDISKKSAISIGLWGAMLTFIGTLFSGLISILLMILVKQQPPWESVGTFIENYHVVQTVPFFFGFLLLSGSLCIFTSIYILSEDKSKPLLGLIFASIGCGLVFLNYLTQNTLIPALVKNYSIEYDSIIDILTMTNPLSMAWALEMWGYGLLGVGTWLVSGFFAKTSTEKIAKYLFVVNGVVSVIGALWTSFNLEWVYETEGLISYLLWNILYILLAIYFSKVMRNRKRKLALD